MNTIILSLFFAGVYLANASYVKDVPCGQVTCPNGDTCCHGDPRPCCPTPNGVCCGHSTCCPSGYSCSGSMCVREEATKKQVISKLFTVKNKKQLMRPSLQVNDVPCNGGYCPSGDTCCPKGGDAPCCPQFNAVCCGDGKSCCPSGYICTGGGHCEVASKNEVLQKILKPFTKKLHNAHVKDIPCDEGTCPDGYTCCSGQSKPCCRTLNAVCCDNGGCCAKGFRCNGTMCVREEATKKQVIPKLSVKNKKRLMRPSLKLNDVPCNGGYCPSGDTCCPKGGDAPCCPQFNAVCCGDGKSCCPSGYICTGGGHCEAASKNEVLQKIPIPFTKKLHNAHVKDIPCGDGYYCPDGQTCCPDGCCPALNAVCCRNGYCCDHGYICYSDHCIRGEAPSKQVLKMLPTSFGKKEKLHNVTDIPCDGSTCPDGDTCCSGDDKPCCPNPNGVCCGNSTCCKTGTTCCPSTDNHSCCPYINAVCCSNDSCCPNGYSCNGDNCQRNSDEESAVLPQMKKLLPSTKTVKSKN